MHQFHLIIHHFNVGVYISAIRVLELMILTHVQGKFLKNYINAIKSLDNKIKAVEKLIKINFLLTITATQSRISIKWHEASTEAMIIMWSQSS